MWGTLLFIYPLVCEPLGLLSIDIYLVLLAFTANTRTLITYARRSSSLPLSPLDHRPGKTWKHHRAVSIGIVGQSSFGL